MKDHFPFAAATAMGLPLAFGRWDVAVLALAVTVLFIPVVYKEEADRIEREERRRGRKR